MKGNAVNVARKVLFTEKKCAILVILASKREKLYDLVKLSIFEVKFGLVYLLSNGPAKPRQQKPVANNLNKRGYY
jgi:hypothetical protein